LPQHDREAFRLPINSAIAGNGESYFAVEGIAPAIVTNRGLVIFKRKKRREDRGDQWEERSSLLLRTERIVVIPNAEEALMQRIAFQI